MTSVWPWIALTLTVITWIIPFLMLFVVPANRKPSSATAWMLLIFAFPWPGLLLFILIGSPKLSNRRIALQKEINVYIKDIVAQAQADPEMRPLLAPEIPARYQPFVDLSTALGALPATAENGVEILTDYDAILARIAADIDMAQRFVHVQFYILIADAATEECFRAMERAVARGVTVRVLYDPVGSRKYPPYRATVQRMQAAGISAYPMLPLYRLDDVNRPDLRNHRKIVVIDGEIAYTGSLNLIHRAYHRHDNLYYDELMVRVCGPAVDTLDAVFRADWYSETGQRTVDPDDPFSVITFTPGGTSLCQVLPSGSGFERENNLRLFVDLIHAAREKLVICNPYFVPDEALMMAVISAALRGVEVTMFNSEARDQFLVSYAQRSYYEELLRSGVKIRLYRSPILLHTKTISIDNDIAVIGSSNMDMRSFELNLEVTLICYDPGVVADLRRAEADYAARSLEVTLDEWRRRPLHKRLFENLTRLMSPLL
ncbi:MAG: cardiolipin synthase [Chloroflexaceae bacterium]